MGIAAFYGATRLDEERLEVSKPTASCPHAADDVVRVSSSTSSTPLGVLIGTRPTYTATQSCSLANGLLPLVSPFRYTDRGAFALTRFKRTGKRDDIFLATKMGVTFNPDRPANGEPAYVHECFNRSLSRLGGTRFLLTPAKGGLNLAMAQSTMSICTTSTGEL